MALQIWEQDSLSILTAFNLLLLQYILFSTLTHKASSSVWNLQFNLSRSAVFLPLASCKPSPPSSFDFVTFCEPTQWIFLVVSNEPHKKFLLTRSTHIFFKEQCSKCGTWLKKKKPIVPRLWVLTCYHKIIIITSLWARAHTRAQRLLYFWGKG